MTLHLLRPTSGNCRYTPHTNNGKDHLFRIVRLTFFRIVRLTFQSQLWHNCGIPLDIVTGLW